MVDVVTNLKRMKGTRTKPAEGDVFAMLLPDEEYVFGRVIGADLDGPRAPMPGSYLIYVYDVRSPSTSVDLALLTPDRLLIPPQYINRMPWTKGYFVKVGEAALQSTDLLARYRFWDPARGYCVDDNGERVDVHEAYGVFGLISYRMLDDLVSDALGIPRVPE